MTLLHNPYQGTVELVADYIIVTTKKGKEQYRLNDVQHARVVPRKPNFDELAKGAIKGTFAGLAGFIAGGLISFGAAAAQGAVLGATVAGACECCPKVEFTLVFQDATTRTWVFISGECNYESVASQINSRCSP